MLKLKTLDAFFKIQDNVYKLGYMRSVYPSDISRERFEIILPDLESCRKKTKPRKLDLYELFCGVLYVLKSGCQWRMLPKEFPKWRNCYDYFKRWSKKPNEDRESVLEIVLKKISWRATVVGIQKQASAS